MASASTKRILIIGTYDTKAAELEFLSQQIRAADGEPVTMDVGVRGAPASMVSVPRDEVARQANTTVSKLAADGDENAAMMAMATGAATIARTLCAEGKIHGAIALGGTMGTDLALEVCQALPLGFPKYIVSTVAFSPLIPPERIAPDLQMILWAGGLYGLNSLCRETLRQAAGAVVGAAQLAGDDNAARPRVGITSLGTSCLKYVIDLVPELESRGFEAIVFHTTGMGGRAYEAMAESGAFAAVMDFSLQELMNELCGSVVNSGTGRLLGAGKSGTPQIVAPGAVDLVDVPAWQSLPAKYRDRPYHAHNRLIGSVVATVNERRRVVREISRRLAAATGPSHVIFPMHGIEEWDRPGEAAHDPDAMQALMQARRATQWRSTVVHDLDAHINDREFVDLALKIFDEWTAKGIVAR